MLACAAWGPQWQGWLVHVWCDNQAAVRAIAAHSCRDPGLMHLLRCLFFMEAFFQFQLSASHIPGVNNTLADLAINYLSSSPRSHRPTPNPQLFHFSYLSCCWTPRWIGPLPPGLNCSVLLRQGRLVHVWCDNQAAVRAITARSCRDPGLMHLLRCLFFIEAFFQFILQA